MYRWREPGWDIPQGLSSFDMAVPCSRLRAITPKLLIAASWLAAKSGSVQPVAEENCL
jgi:hypothetical protein